MTMGSLPDCGELTLGPVTLPAGKRVMSAFGSAVPVAWVTLRELPDPGRVWAALSQVQQETGLVPFLAAGLGEGTERPWDEGEFEDPADVSGLDELDAAVLLQDLWNGRTNEVGEDDEEHEEDEEFAEYIAAAIAPFPRQFPGLAPAVVDRLSPEQLRDVLGSLRPARIGIAAAARPADVLPLIGWTGAANWGGFTAPIAAILRSWEDRFGARLLEVGFAQIRLLVERPPRTLQAAQRIAVEHFSFCDECGGRGLSDIPGIADYLIDSTIWTFWWD